jgi:hypothetical protein
MILFRVICAEWALTLTTSTHGSPKSKGGKVPRKEEPVAALHMTTSQQKWRPYTHITLVATKIKDGVCVAAVGFPPTRPPLLRHRRLFFGSNGCGWTKNVACLLCWREETLLHPEGGPFPSAAFLMYIHTRSHASLPACWHLAFN